MVRETGAERTRASGYCPLASTAKRDFGAVWWMANWRVARRDDGKLIDGCLINGSRGVGGDGDQQRKYAPEGPSWMFRYQSWLGSLGSRKRGDLL